MSDLRPRVDPVFAVIIPTFRRPAQLRRCLSALAAQRYPASRFEVVVVDDGGGDPIDEILGSMPEIGGSGLRVRALRQSNGGPGSARNAGAAATDAQYLAFTDDDCLPDPGWLEALAQRMHNDAVGHCLYGGRVVTSLPWNACTEASQLIVDLSYAFHNPGPEDARFFASSNMSMPAARFRALGGFAPSFRLAAEDRDLCERWAEAGGRLSFVNDAAITHVDELTVRGFVRRHFSYGRGAWQFHAALRARNRGRLWHDVQFHTGFLSRAGRRLAEVRGMRKFQLAALLALWQCANAAGFLYEALRTALTTGGPAASGARVSDLVPNDAYRQRTAQRVNIR